MSRAIDEERRRHFFSEGAHFESEHALLIQYTPPIRRKSRIADLVYSDGAVPLEPKKQAEDRRSAENRLTLAMLTSEVSPASLSISKTAFATA